MVSLGDFLKRERDARGVTLEEIAARTRIRPKFLQALEEDRHENLPEPPYVEGFLRSYLACLGIDATEAVANYRTMVAANGAEATPPPPKRRGSRLGLLLAISGGTAIISAGIYLAVGAGERPKGPVGPPSPTATTTPKGVPSPQELASYLQAFETEPFPLALQTHHETWMRIQIDEDRVVEFTMQPGQSKILEIRREAVVDIGNAGGVQVQVNGKDFGFLGRPSQVIKGVRVTRGGVSFSPDQKEEGL